MSEQLWSAPTYWDALVAGRVAEPLPVTAVTNSLLSRVRCGCGALVWPQEILDVAGLDSAITGGRRFVCSGEVGLWIDKRDVPLDRVSLITALGAPVAHIERIAGRDTPKNLKIKLKKGNRT